MVRERTGRLRVFPSVGPSLTVGPTGGLASLSLSLSLSMCLEEGQDTGGEGRGGERRASCYSTRTSIGVRSHWPTKAVRIVFVRPSTPSALPAAKLAANE